MLSTQEAIAFEIEFSFEGNCPFLLTTVNLF